MDFDMEKYFYNIDNRNKDISLDLRTQFRKYHKVRTLKNKTKRQAEMQEWQDDIKTARRRLKGATAGKGYITITYEDDYESWLNIYKEPVEFAGTKQELDRVLWEEYATVINSPYDCTGQPFTSHFKIAHITGNLWKVAEAMGLDV